MSVLTGEVRLWERNLEALIAAGFYATARVEPCRGLYAVVGVYPDGSSGAPLARFERAERAEYVVRGVLARSAGVEPD